MEQVRTFIAVELPDDIKTKLEEVESSLKSGRYAPAKWVDPGNIHLTLKFLGDVDSDRITGIMDALENAAGDAVPFSIEVSGLGVFPGTAKTRVVWAGLSGELDRLNSLQQNVESAMEKLGFPREKRRFSPHLTLARVRDQATPDERRRLGETVAGTAFRGGTVQVTSINLMKSLLTKKGAVYTRLGSVTFV